MPLASLANLQWNGPAAGAVVSSSVASSTISVKAWGTADAIASGVGQVTNADATRLVNSPCTVQGVGLLASADVIADGKPSMVVSIGARPSAFDIAQSVWLSDAASLNATGTTGNKLNASGSAGDPWSAIIESGLTASQAMRLIVAALAGKVSGADGSTVTIRNAVADDADRIIATVDADGNRTAITYDLD